MHSPAVILSEYFFLGQVRTFTKKLLINLLFLTQPGSKKIECVMILLRYQIKYRATQSLIPLHIKRQHRWNSACGDAMIMTTKWLRQSKFAKLYFITGLVLWWFCQWRCRKLSVLFWSNYFLAVFVPEIAGKMKQTKAQTTSDTY